jgi:hypothetical protein
MTKDEKEVLKMVSRFFVLSERNDGWNDLLSGTKLRELHTAITLGHKVTGNINGIDAMNKDRAEEYKNTNQPRMRGTWGGLPIRETEKETVQAFKQLKLDKVDDFYFTRSNKKTGDYEEIWHVSRINVQRVMIPKLKAAYARVYGTETKCLKIHMDDSDIRKYGKQVKLKRAA